MNIGSGIASRLWQFRARKDWLDFLRAASKPKEVQSSLLLETINRNKQTSYGQIHYFSKIRTLDDYKRQVPITTYEDYRPFIGSIMEGKHPILTKEKVRVLEPTSGSTSASKYIPYNQALKQEFQRAINCWIYNLYCLMPGIKWGKAYWSISPNIKNVVFPVSKIRIGFEDDSEYLGGVERFLLNRAIVNPQWLSEIEDIHQFQTMLLFCLLSEENLRLISIWSPTYMTTLLDEIEPLLDSVLQIMSTGKLPAQIQECLPFDTKISGNKKRAREIEALVNKYIFNSEIPVFEKIWPRLQLISCWVDGQSSIYAKHLQTYFPTTSIQPKGLIATEAIASFPIDLEPGSILAINSHFYEFLECDTNGATNMTGGKTLTIQDLEIGKKYEIVVTTGGGLYRYRLQDVIEVIGMWKSIPRIRFIGKSDGISDLVGEKLNPIFVQKVLDGALEELDIEPACVMLTPDYDEYNRPFYALCISCESPRSTLVKLKLLVERKLRDNYYYDVSLKLKQLSPLRLFKVDAGFNINNAYLEFMRSKGMKLGDIKTSVLCRNTGLILRLNGMFL